mmetsp:Transcript_72378/g.157902  ORF Transcript_72378/g.157902 Transcript_72378/m.157902 type:complete len:121 (+) Transcript_72378:802-1164(+)
MAGGTIQKRGRTGPSLPRELLQASLLLCKTRTKSTRFSQQRMDASPAVETKPTADPKAEAPKVKVEGYADYSSGHKGPTPHFFTTYQQLGRYQPVDYQRYDFGAVAKNYRFTRWQSMRES